MIRHFWLFVAAELVFSLTPGPAAMLVGAHGFRGGWRGAILANLGIQTGNAIYVVISALGLGAVLAASATAFSIIKILGAAYLTGLGLWTLWHAGKAKEDVPAAQGRPYTQAVLTQLANPKAIFFFGAFLPQFVNSTATLLPQYGVMFAVIVLGESVILSGYGWLGTQGRRLGALGRWREYVGGAVLIAIGAIFAMAERS